VPENPTKPKKRALAGSHCDQGTAHAGPRWRGISFAPRKGFGQPLIYKQKKAPMESPFCTQDDRRGAGTRDGTWIDGHLRPQLRRNWLRHQETLTTDLCSFYKKQQTHRCWLPEFKHLKAGHPLPSSKALRRRGSQLRSPQVKSGRYTGTVQPKRPKIEARKRDDLTRQGRRGGLQRVSRAGSQGRYSQKRGARGPADPD